MGALTFRLLNDYDLFYDVEAVGITSKEIIYGIVKRSLELDKGIKFNTLSKSGQDSLTKTSMIVYLKKEKSKLKKFEH